MVGINFDVTEVRCAEEALRHSEAKLRTLFKLSPLGIALNDFTTGEFLEVNDAFADSTGYSQSELCALDYWRLTPPDYAE
ncbi:MAG: PAS domain S-box-containing protein [Lentimonas sp.]|jgi:PAS domain S-box-containing protein